MTTVRPLTIEDIPSLAAAMARAFDDDPLQVWAVPDPVRRVALLELTFGVLMEHLDLPYGCSSCDESRATVALWLPPKKNPLSNDGLAALRDIEAQMGTARPRLQAAQDAMDAVRPEEEHFYLQGLGTDPPFQRRGLASAALAPMLARCDEEGAPAYLESTKERNVAFYERHGFRLTGTIDVPPDGPRLWTMWREPLGRL